MLDTRFDFKPQPQAAAIVRELIDGFLARHPQAADLARRMKDVTGTRFLDWIDHILVSRKDPGFVGLRERLLAAGFSHVPQMGAKNAFLHLGAIFPEILLDEHPVSAIVLKVDSVADFLNTWQLHDAAISGRPGAPVRIAPVWRNPEAELWVIERHGVRGYADPDHFPTPIEQTVRAMEHAEALRRRRRDFESDAEGFAYTNLLVDRAIADLGRDWTCSIFFEAERRYWMTRNRAAQVQKARQDKLGLGWANHDHHTYRSSRECFKELIGLWEKLGFTCRERFYAGAEAGWGAQVMEQTAAGITTFNDVDMSPEELMGDFSHAGLPASTDKLGTVGLWCGLHGEAVLRAGMHHLECQFDWHALRDQLETEAHIKTMDPFTTFPYLRQAFTAGERWSIDSRRIDRLLQRNLITRDQAEEFRAHGAIGSHLENLERNDGFKGFNQQGVSDIIARTDPRRQTKAKSHS